CILIGCISAALIKTTAPVTSSRSAFKVGVWLAALCPITANYTAILLTESIAINLTAVSIYFLIRLAQSCSEIWLPVSGLRASWDKSPAYWAVALGISVGALTYFRPESPILLVSAWLALLLYFAKHSHFARGCKLALLSVFVLASSLS